MDVLLKIGYTGAAIVALGWLYRKIFTRFYFPVHDTRYEENVKGKLVLITGANTGLGKEAAFEMGKRGAKVILASRNLDLTRKAIQDISKRLNGKHNELIPMKLDLGSIKSIREFSKEFHEQFDKVDILINNAGVSVPDELRRKTEDGFDMTFGINHLGTFLLTNLLLDLLKKAAPSRIVILASGMSEKGEINFDDLMMKNWKPNPEQRGFAPPQAYCNSKLANLHFAKELSKRLEGTNVHVYAMCPGWIMTDLGRHFEITWKIMISIFPSAFLFMGTVREGVQTILHCALSTKIRNENGKFYQYCKNWEPKVDVTDEKAKKLWKVSEDLLKM